MDNVDTLRTAEGEPDVLLHHQETDIEPAVRNLVGKKLCEGEGETNDTMFSTDDLPPGTRIIKAPGKWATTEHAPSRLTVVVDDDGTVSHVFTG